MNGIDLTTATLMIDPVQGLLVGIAFGLLCYFIGRLTMALDYRFNQKKEQK